MRRIISALSFMLFISLIVTAEDIKEWRAPTQKDLGNDFSWRKENADLYLIVKADFDGDHKEDMPVF